MTSPLLEAFEIAREHEQSVNKEGAMPGVDGLNAIVHEIGAYGISAVVEGPGMAIAENTPNGVALHDRVFYSATAGEFLGFADALMSDISGLSISGSYSVGALTRSHSDNYKVIWTPVSECEVHDVCRLLDDVPLYTEIQDALLDDEVDIRLLSELCAKTATLSREQFMSMRAVLEYTTTPFEHWSAIYASAVFIPSCPEYMLEQSARVAIGPDDFFTLIKTNPENMYRRRQIGSVSLAVVRRPSHVLMQDVLYLIDADTPFEKSRSTL
jgi:hypothetical protein